MPPIIHVPIPHTPDDILNTPVIVRMIALSAQKHGPEYIYVIVRNDFPGDTYIADELGVYPLSVGSYLTVQGVHESEWDPELFHWDEPGIRVCIVWDGFVNFRSLAVHISTVGSN